MNHCRFVRAWIDHVERDAGQCYLAVIGRHQELSWTRGRKFFHLEDDLRVCPGYDCLFLVAEFNTVLGRAHTVAKIRSIYRDDILSIAIGLGDGVELRHVRIQFTEGWLAKLGTRECGERSNGEQGNICVCDFARPDIEVEGDGLVIRVIVGIGIAGIAWIVSHQLVHGRTYAGWDWTIRNVGGR